MGGAVPQSHQHDADDFVDHCVRQVEHIHRRRTVQPLTKNRSESAGEGLHFRAERNAEMTGAVHGMQMNTYLVCALRCIVAEVTDRKNFTWPWRVARNAGGIMEQQFAAFGFAATGKERHYGLESGRHRGGIRVRTVTCKELPGGRLGICQSTCSAGETGAITGMALTFVHCPSCGGRTQINPRLSMEEQRCLLCGKPCGMSETDFEIPEDKPSGEKPAMHTPKERRAGTCPHCFANVVIDTTRELRHQSCSVCGHQLIKKRNRNQEKEAEAPTAEADLFRRAGERVGLPIAGITLAVVLAGIWTLWIIYRPETKNADPEITLPPSEDALLTDLIAKFSAAQSPEEVLPLVRQPEAHGGSVRAWLAKHPGPVSPGGAFLRIVSRRTALGTNLCQVAVNGRKEPLLLAETKDGWRVEWRAFAAEGDLSVEECRLRRPERPVLVLAVVRRSDYFNGPYLSNNVWQCLHVGGSKGDPGFYAYVPRNDLAMKEKLKVLPAPRIDGEDREGASRRLALRVRFASEEAKRLELAEVVAVEGDGWFIP